LEAGGLPHDEIAKIINDNAFADSSFFIMPYLQSGEWKLPENPKNINLKMPITNLQKSWLKALLTDKRMRLFLDNDQIIEAERLLSNVDPLYEADDFHYFDSAADGDPYDDENYIKNFRIILAAIKNKSGINIEYDSGKGKRINKKYLPTKFNFSQRDDKLRVIVVSEDEQRAILNLSRIKSVSVCEKIHVLSDSILDKTMCETPIVLQITKDRNALERLMVQFAWVEKQTEYDEVTDSYICRIFYNRQDESEMLIRILSFGPVIKVLEPESFLLQMRERIKKQFEMIR